MEWRVVVEWVQNEQDLFRRRRLPGYMIRMQGIADRYHLGHWPKPGERLPIWQGTEEQHVQLRKEVDELNTDVMTELKLSRGEEIEMSF